MDPIMQYAQGTWLFIWGGGAIALACGASWLGNKVRLALRQRSAKFRSFDDALDTPYTG